LSVFIAKNCQFEDFCEMLLFHYILRYPMVYETI